VKLVTAVLAPDKLDAVARALAEKEVFRMTATECRGVVRNADGAPSVAEKVRLEIAVNENFVQPTIDAIRSAQSLPERAGDDPRGDSGFGKIFVSELLDVVRIRTGERGPDAI
jgi:nitrogen regulatory protein P-II 1